MANVGFRIFTTFTRPDAALVAQFRDLPVAVIGDEMQRLACLDARIKPLNGAPLLGVAFTVRARGGDNLLLHRALDMAAPGDVIVVDGQGDLSNALAGEIMTTRAQRRGLAGLVVDGAMRDLAAIAQMAFPVYAAGIQPKGPYKNGPGEINVPISCGGIVIYPGDIIVGDADGVVAVQPREAPAVVQRAQERHRKEELTLQKLRDGTPGPSAYTAQALRDLGCEIIDGAWHEHGPETQRPV
jgi:RraA family protein